MKVLIEKIINAGALEIRDVDNGEEPFLYASGNWGPGYVSIKNLVSNRQLMREMAFRWVADNKEYLGHIEFVAGNVTGGMVPGWLIAEYLSEAFGRDIPYAYVRDTRKKGGHKEAVTGIDIGKRQVIPLGPGLVIEELINFAQTSCNSVLLLRDLKYWVDYVGCFLFYDNPLALSTLQKHRIGVKYLFTLKELLDVAQGRDFFDRKKINSYREFLSSPIEWQEKRGLVPVKSGGTK
jgi:orotate phosphoribosyltransferase